MNRILMAAGLTLLLCGCGRRDDGVQCPDVAAVAPASIGVPFVANLTGQYAGPDRETSILEAITQIHQRDPSLDADTITNILIAADCPNALKRPDHDISAVRDSDGAFRAQVDQILGNTADQ